MKLRDIFGKKTLDAVTNDDYQGLPQGMEHILQYGAMGLAFVRNITPEIISQAGESGEQLKKVVEENVMSEIMSAMSFYSGDEEFPVSQKDRVCKSMRTTFELMAFDYIMNELKEKEPGFHDYIKKQLAVDNRDAGINVKLLEEKVPALKAINHLLRLYEPKP